MLAQASDTNVAGAPKEAVRAASGTTAFASMHAWPPLSHTRPLLAVADRAPLALLGDAVLDRDAVARAVGDRVAGLLGANPADSVVVAVERMRLRQAVVQVVGDAVALCVAGSRVVKRRRRHPRVRAPLLRRPQRGLHRAARAPRRPTRATAPAARGPQRPGRVADSVSRWLDWT